MEGTDITELGDHTKNHKRGGLKQHMFISHWPVGQEVQVKGASHQFLACIWPHDGGGKRGRERDLLSSFSDKGTNPNTGPHPYDLF